MATLDDAAQEGAQFASRRGPASSKPASDADIAAYVRGRIYSAAPQEVTVGVAWSSPGAQTVTISAEYQFRFLANFVPLPTVVLRGTSSMTVL